MRVTSLQERLSSEHRDLFEQVYREHFSALCNFLMRFGLNGENARDLAHDAYLRVVRQNALERLQENPRSYLCQVAFNLLRDQKRRAEHRTSDRHMIFQEEKAVSPLPSPESDAQQQQRVERLKEALMHLSPKHRHVLLLQRLDGLTCGQVSSRLGLSLRSVQRYLKEALCYCEAKLDIKE